MHFFKLEVLWTAVHCQQDRHHLNRLDARYMANLWAELIYRSLAQWKPCSLQTDGKLLTDWTTGSLTKVKSVWHTLRNGSCLALAGYSLAYFCLLFGLFVFLLLETEILYTLYAIALCLHGRAIIALTQMVISLFFLTIQGFSAKLLCFDALAMCI